MKREKTRELSFGNIKGNLLIIFNDTGRRPFLMGKKPHKAGHAKPPD